MAKRSEEHVLRPKLVNWDHRKNKGKRKNTDWQSIENDRERYAAYLCSREWSVLKEAVHKRSGKKCERCGILPIDAVHHLTYERKYHENLDDLQGICSWCHEFTHGKTDLDPASRPLSFAVRSLWYVKKAGGYPPPLMFIYGQRNLAGEVRQLQIAYNVLVAAGFEYAAHCLNESLPFCAMSNDFRGAMPFRYQDGIECYARSGFSANVCEEYLDTGSEDE